VPLSYIPSPGPSEFCNSEENINVGTVGKGNFSATWTGKQRDRQTERVFTGNDAKTQKEV
jgi:hypothetical protein